jgi:hypothetical protein
MSHQIFLRRYKLLLLHIPLILCFIIPIIWYSLLIFVYPCKNILQYLSFQCGVLCYLKNSPAFINFENFTFFIVPIIIIVIVNMTLIVSVLIQKSQMKRARRFGLWRSHLRMIIQLMSIAILYLSIHIPSCILLIMGTYTQYNRFQSWAVRIRIQYFIHLKYLVIFGYPFVVLAGQREMLQAMRDLTRTRWRTRVIVVTAVPILMNATLQKRH